MDKIHECTAGIGGLDQTRMEEVRQRLDRLTKPQGSLGRLEEIAKTLAGITGKETPPLKQKAIFTLAADHGIAEEGVSAYPKEVTAQMVLNFLRGGAAINVLAAQAGARVVIADLGVDFDFPPVFGLVVKKINRGTKNMLTGPAMTREEAGRSIEAGIELFEAEYEKGLDVIGAGDMGIGNTTASSAMTAVMTGKPVVEVTGRGTGIDDKRLAKKIGLIEKAIALNRPDPDDSLDILSKVGGFEIGGLAGVMLAAASKRIPVVIDGFISGAAALIACGLEPKTKCFLIAAHSSVEKGHKSILERLGLKPLLDLDLRLGEGTGAALAMPILEASVNILSGMATFESAAVSRSHDQKG